MSKLPAFQFYPGDWQKDPGLRRCSKAAKGVWIDMMCLMFECEDRGVFASGGKPWSLEEIAGAIGGDLAENLTCIDELLRKGVASLTKLGAISNRRMVRDEEQRANNRGYQHKHRNSIKTNENSKTNVRVMSGPSSSSTSTTKLSTPQPPSRGAKRVRPQPRAQEPTSVERFAGLIEDRHPWTGMSPHQLVSKATDEGMFAETDVTPGEVEKVLTEWHEARCRVKEKEASRGKA